MRVVQGSAKSHPWLEHPIEIPVGLVCTHQAMVRPPALLCLYKAADSFLVSVPYISMSVMKLHGRNYTEHWN